MTELVEAPPAPDEIEVTLLGRGVGESCLVHLGQGRWMVVDSFNVNGRAAALDYLDDIGVPYDAVEHLVVTHFHTDHFRGIEELHDECPNAVLHITEALEVEEFRKLHVVDEDPGFLEGLPAVIERAKQRRVGPAAIPGLNTLRLSVSLARGAGVHAVAISPTREAIAASTELLASALATTDPAVVNATLRDENRSSVAIHIDATAAFGCSVLLGADLVASPKSLGWHAVINDPLHADLPSTQLTKVAHHGSAHNHDDEAWARLSDPGSTLLVAPYWSSSIPDDDDIARLAALGSLFVAAPQAKWETVDGHRRAVDIAAGAVQARRGAGDNQWRVGRRPPAFKV